MLASNLSTKTSCARLASPESGFTLIELIVSSAIIAILAGLAIEAYIIHREDSYHKIAMQMMGQTRTALEAGKVDSESFPDAELVFDQSEAGPPVNGDGELLVPGLVLPNDFRIRVTHNPNCTIAGCVEDFVITRHCKTHRRVWYTKAYQFGEMIIFDAADNTEC